MMKKLLTPALFTALVLMFGLTSCLEDRCDLTRTYTAWEPVYLGIDELRQPIETEAPRELKQPGKIYYYQQYLLITERTEGIHVIDNSDPENPIPISFINIPGNVDMAVRGDYLYADNYIDLVVLDISNPEAPKYEGRTENVFPFYTLYSDFGYLIDYVETQKTEEISCNSPFWDNDFFFIDDVIFVNRGFEFDSSVLTANSSSSSGNNGAVSVGVGGSMARFTITGQYLYTVDDSSLDVLDLTNARQPSLAKTIEIGWGIETIFPYGNHLFIGANNGMHIFDNSNPLSPQHLSTFAHVRSCDPVFVSGNLAYVTLRNGNFCQGFVNQLDVIDVSDLSNPFLLKSYPMHNPHGLSITEDHLYLCEGDQGLKVFDINDWETIDQNLVAHLQGFFTFDIITIGSRKLAMVIGEDGLHQFDITDPSNLKALSVLSTK